VEGPGEGGAPPHDQPLHLDTCTTGSFSPLARRTLRSSTKEEASRLLPARGSTPARGGRQGSSSITQEPVPRKGWAFLLACPEDVTLRGDYTDSADNIKGGRKNGFRVHSS
jgi:hypothetical protein